MGKVLYTGFKSENAFEKESPEKLIEQIKKKDTFLFSNDYTLIIHEIDKIMEEEKYDYILMFGQKPLIKKLSIEMICKQKKEYIPTNFPVAFLTPVLEKNNISYKLSQNPGTSYCNFAYYNMLKCVQVRALDTKIIFIHIPYLNHFEQIKEVINLLNQ